MHVNYEDDHRHPIIQIRTLTIYIGYEPHPNPIRHRGCPPPPPPKLYLRQYQRGKPKCNIYIRLLALQAAYCGIILVKIEKITRWKTNGVHHHSISRGWSFCGGQIIYSTRLSRAARKKIQTLSHVHIEINNLFKKYSGRYTASYSPANTKYWGSVVLKRHNQAKIMASVAENGPALKQHWLQTWSFLGRPVLSEYIAT